MPQPPLHLTFAGLTDVGRTRARNEDCFGISEAIGLAVVCDGMGGHAGGDVASRTVTEAISDFLYEFEPAKPASAPPDAAGTVTQARDGGPAVEDAGSLIRSAVRLANRRLAALNHERGYADGRGMGTTVVGLWRVEGTDRAVVFHAGDSRLYRLRGDELRQVTRDHSLYQVWLDTGAKGPAPQRNIIVRALGTAQDADVDVAPADLRDGDLYMLCSDGLTGMLDDKAIATVLVDQGRRDPAGACARLVALANAAGGHDNITVVLVRVGAP